MKTIALPEDLHRELLKLKIYNRNKNVAELIRKLVYEYRQKQFLEFSNLFRQRLKEKGMSFKEFLKKSEKIREELSNGKFS